MNYPSIRIEGAILSPDILDRLEDLPGQRPADFGLPPATKVKDEIARAWADAQDYWRIYQRKLEALPRNSLATTETRNFWIVPLLGLLGYQLEYQNQSTPLGDKHYPLSHRTLNRALATVHIVGANDPAGLDRKPERTHGPRMSAHALVQEYLNLSEQLYALVTNGRLLRLLRDSSRLVKLTYLEFDLDRIFTDGLFADFALLYRLLHVTRMPATPETPAESLIERYHQDSVDSGARIRAGLSQAVENAIKNFANGLLAHPANEALRAAVLDGTLTPGGYYHHLLRLIYRLLFLLVIEERNLVYPLAPSVPQRDLYYRYYSLQRLRRLAEQRYLADPRHNDVWLALLACFRLFEDGGPGTKLGIAPLAGDLFGPSAIGPIADCQLDNRTVLECLRSLSLYTNPETKQIIRVSYAALNVEEFGSVYEGLLEYEPAITPVGDRLEFAFQLGDERAATGSHYTPDDLVQPLIKHSLDYLIADKLKEADPARALLSLRVADIACGSGHILLAAARRIATALAIVRTGEEQPAPTAFRVAVRDVIRECIYGVDLNPLAVELCKVALWLEAHCPGQPLNFLDHHIKCGNAIVGFAHREELDKGIPDEAFTTLPGDDKAVASALRKRNKEARQTRTQQQFTFAPELQQQLTAIRERFGALSALPERNPKDIALKKQRYDEFNTSADACLLRQIAAIPVAQFYLPKTEANRAKLITDEEYRAFLGGQRIPQGQATGAAWALAVQKRVFHWFLEFPDIATNGGFDCILGNPPFLGNRDLKSTYGESFLNWVRVAFAPAGSVDLVTYFYRRAFTLLKPYGYLALIATKTIYQGNAREGGLDQILSAGGSICSAVRTIRWPGKAAVDVAIIAIFKGPWTKIAYLDGRPVRQITSYLDTSESTLGDPRALCTNVDKSFQGTIVLGEGFILKPQEAKALIERNPRNGEVVLPFLIGDDINSKPDQSPSQYVINFYDWSEEKAQTYPDCYQIILERVKPERTRVDDRGNFVLRKPLPHRWWIYADKRPKLYTKIAGLKRVLVGVRISKYLNMILLDNGMVFNDKVIATVFDNYAHFAVLQSSLHEIWAWKYCGTLGSTTLIYSPTKCFVTFPFPDGLSRAGSSELNSIGELYHEHRRALMLQLGLGLTKIYNLFHDVNLTSALVARICGNPAKADDGYQSILQLRELHRKLDEAVLATYGWSDLPLGHDFHEIETLPENDRLRYTISPTARKSVLQRLLAENHRRAATEAQTQTLTATAQATTKPKRGRKAKAETLAATGAPGLFSAVTPQQIEDARAVQYALALLYTWDKPVDRRTFDVGMLLMHMNSLRQRVLKAAVTSPAPTAVETPQVGNMDEFLGEMRGSGALLVTQTETRQLIQRGPNALPVTELENRPPDREAFTKAQETVQAVAILNEQNQLITTYMGDEDHVPVEIAIL